MNYGRPRMRPFLGVGLAAASKELIPILFRIPLQEVRFC